jgi:UDP-glucose 4-epimerase
VTCLAIFARFPVANSLNTPFSSSLAVTALTHGSGTGYIGSFTTLALLEADYKVVIVDNLYNSSPEVVNRIELICGKRPAFYECDITDEAALDKVFAEHPDIDNVIHFAALKVATAHTPRREDHC